MNHPGHPMSFLSPPASTTQGARSPLQMAQQSQMELVNTPPFSELDQSSVPKNQVRSLTPPYLSGIGAKQTPPIRLGSGSPSPSPLLNPANSPQSVSPGIGSGESGDPTNASGDPSYDIILKDGAVTDSRTTLFIKNIPHRVNPSTFLSVMTTVCPIGFKYLYLPNNKQNPRSNNGYAFIKLKSKDFVPAVMSALNYKQWPRYNSDKICEVKYATVQSFVNLLRQFDSSPLLSDRDRWRPFVMYKGEYVPLTSEIFNEVYLSAQLEGEEKE